MAATVRPAIPATSSTEKSPECRISVTSRKTGGNLRIAWFSLVASWDCTAIDSGLGKPSEKWRYSPRSSRVKSSND